MRLKEMKVRLGLLLLTLIFGLVLSDVSETWAQYKARMDKERKSRAKNSKNSQSVERSYTEIHSRQKRSIGFPTGSTFTITPVLCIPVVSLGDVSGNLDIELPFKINLPNGTSNTITHKFEISRKDEDRRGIYSVITNALDRLGFNGKSCLLRAICEISEAPLKHDGLLGEILNIILSITTPGTNDPTLHDYSEAEYQGRAYGECWSKYNECPISLFRLMDG